MDKTLSDHCYIKIKYTGEIWFYTDDYQKIFCENDGVFWEKISDVMNNDDYTEYYKDNQIEIIGHYDITAVLKLICDSTRDFIWDSRYDYWLEEIYIFTEWKIEKIPNKPLHLYTEQEEIDLLKLLKELWTT